MADKEKLQQIADEDVVALMCKDAEYGESWRRRGGVGAFMMLARKWDRIEIAVKKELYDIFEAIINDNRPEGLLDDIQDLRRYLILVESHVTHAAIGRPDGMEHPFGYDAAEETR